MSSLEDSSFAFDEDVLDLWKENKSDEEDGGMEWPPEMLQNLEDLDMSRRKRRLSPKRRSKAAEAVVPREEGDDEGEGRRRRECTTTSRLGGKPGLGRLSLEPPTTQAARVGKGTPPAHTLEALNSGHKTAPPCSLVRAEGPCIVPFRAIGCALPFGPKADVIVFGPSLGDVYMVGGPSSPFIDGTHGLCHGGN